MKFYSLLVINTNHGAVDMRFALSVLQLIWVAFGLFLYAPLAVSMIE